LNNSVKIGPAFFAKEKNDYSDWRTAWVRELAQNGIDAPKTKRIEFSVALHPNGKDTCATVTNDGTPMTKEVLTEKFLALGESGKNFAEGSVGGFGKAKIIIAFSHNSYSIRTGDLFVQGEGAQYSLAEGLGYVNGTTTQVVMDGDEVGGLTKAVRRFAAFAQWDGEILLNGERLDCNLRKGSPRREFAWGTVYTNKTFQNRVIVRINGIPMFTEYTSLDRTVIVELKGSSVETLTSNRDGLVYKHRQEFQQFLLDLVTNKSRALKAKNPHYRRFSGAKYAHKRTEAARVNARDLVGDVTGSSGARKALVVTQTPQAGSGASHPAQGAPEGGEWVPAGSGGSFSYDNGRIGVLEDRLGGDSDHGVEYGTYDSDETSKVSTISEFFVVKNETTLKVPDYYQPDSDQFGSYGKKLARIWGRLLIQAHRLFDHEASFGIGFVFSDDCEAQHEEGDEFGTVYYLNPAKIVEQTGSASKSFKKRFALTERDRLLSLAIHEIGHGIGHDSHDENYARWLTDAFARVMKERKSFNWCFA
jgi:hypothetical protein